MIKYVLREDTAYGISAVDENGNTLKTIPAIHTDETTVKDFVDLCNDEKLELVHFENVVEDLKQK